MYHLWAPWRMEYIESADVHDDRCFLCEKRDTPNKDDENYVLYRGEVCFALLNTFPYNNGHLMIAPYRHIGEIELLSSDESLETMQIVQLAVRSIKVAMGAQGFNIGYNLGRVAGAGLVEHIHLHIVPRWSGDTNFMPILSDTKVLSEALVQTYEKLLQYFRGELK